MGGSTIIYGIGYTTHPKVGSNIIVDLIQNTCGIQQLLSQTMNTIELCIIMLNYFQYLNPCVHDYE